MSQKILDANRQDVVNLYKAGVNCSEIGRQFEVNSGQVYTYLRDKCNITMKKKKRFEDYTPKKTNCHIFH